MHELHVFLEDSKTVKELQAKVSDLEQKLRAADAKVLETERKYINEVTKNLALEDKVSCFWTRC